MALSGNEVAILTARFGAARFGASRFGFCPKDTKGVAIGTAGPFYTWWKRQYQATASWTLRRS